MTDYLCSSNPHGSIIEFKMKVLASAEVKNRESMSVGGISSHLNLRKSMNLAAEQGDSINSWDCG